jgi:hypothetical protein
MHTRYLLILSIVLRALAHSLLQDEGMQPQWMHVVSCNAVPRDTSTCHVTWYGQPSLPDGRACTATSRRTAALPQGSMQYLTDDSMQQQSIIPARQPLSFPHKGDVSTTQHPHQCNTGSIIEAIQRRCPCLQMIATTRQPCTQRAASMLHTHTAMASSP